MLRRRHTLIKNKFYDIDNELSESVSSEEEICEIVCA